MPNASISPTAIIADLAPKISFEQEVLQENDGLFVESYQKRTRDYEAVDQLNNSSNAEASRKTTEWQTFFHLLKGYVGPGCLSLPWAVSQLGILPGCCGIGIMAVWSSYNSCTVVQLKRLYQQEHQQKQQQQQQQQQDSDDSSHHHHAGSSSIVVTYPVLSRWLFGRRMEAFTTASVCIQQLAICTVFLSFVGANLQAVLETVISAHVSHFAVITAAMPACMAMSCLPDLKAIAPMTAAGTGLLLAGLGLLLTVICIEWDERPVDTVITVDWSTVPLALCAILFSFEGICLILPVEGSMGRPQRFFPTFYMAMIASASIFCLVSGLSVTAFGEVTNGSITAFLLEKYATGGNDQNDHLQGILLIANAAVSFSVLVTYPLQLFPCLELVGPLLDSFLKTGTCGGGNAEREQDLDLAISHAASGGEHHDGDFASCLADDPGRKEDIEPIDDDCPGRKEDIEPIDDDCPDGHTVAAPIADTSQTRVFLVLLTYVAAIVIPNVESLISLAGALAGTSTALLIPPMLQIAHCKRENTTEGVARSYALFVGGFILMFIGTYSSVMGIVKIYSA